MQRYIPSDRAVVQCAREARSEILMVEFSMKAAVVPFNSSDWRPLYRAAILEEDRAAVPRRVLEAEQAGGSAWSRDPLHPQQP